MNDGIVDKVGPTRLGSSAPADINPSRFNPAGAFSLSFDMHTPPFSLKNLFTVRLVHTIK